MVTWKYLTSPSATPKVKFALTNARSVHSNPTKVKFALTNARSVHSKLDDIRNLLESANADVVCITETWEEEHHD